MVKNRDNVSFDDKKNNKKFMVLPYIKNITKFAKASILNSNIKFGFNVSIGFQCLNRLDRFIIAHKDKNNSAENNNVVYNNVVYFMQ